MFKDALSRKAAQTKKSVSFASDGGAGQEDPVREIEEEEGDMERWMREGASSASSRATSSKPPTTVPKENSTSGKSGSPAFPAPTNAMLEELRALEAFEEPADFDDESDMEEATVADVSVNGGKSWTRPNVAPDLQKAQPKPGLSMSTVAERFLHSRVDGSTSAREPRAGAPGAGLVGRVPVSGKQLHTYDGETLKFRPDPLLEVRGAKQLPKSCLVLGEEDSSSTAVAAGGGVGTVVADEDRWFRGSLSRSGGGGSEPEERLLPRDEDRKPLIQVVDEETGPSKDLRPTSSSGRVPGRKGGLFGSALKESDVVGNKTSGEASSSQKKASLFKQRLSGAAPRY